MRKRGFEKDIKKDMKDLFHKESFKSSYLKNATYFPNTKLLFITTLLLLLSVSFVLALTTTIQQPISGNTWELTLFKINATTDYNANCTYNVSDGTNFVYATLLGNDTLQHYTTNVDISSLNDGSFVINVSCWNSSDGAFSFDDSVTGIKDTSAPQITWKNPIADAVITPSSVIVLNITGTLTGQRGFDTAKLDVFDVSDCGGSLVGTPFFSCSPINTCNVTQTWNAPAASNPSCNITANLSTSMDSIWNTSTINVSIASFSRPNVSLLTPIKGAVPRIHAFFNFSVEVNDTSNVQWVTIYNGTGYQQMVMSGSDPKHAVWWAAVDTTYFVDGVWNLYVNASNGVGYNDTEYFTVRIDNEGPMPYFDFPPDEFNTSENPEDFDYVAIDNGIQTGDLMNCTLYFSNASHTVIAMVNNGSVVNDTISENTLFFTSGPGDYYVDVTCYDGAVSNMAYMDQGNAGSSGTVTVHYDTIPPVPLDIFIGEPDIYVSGYPPNQNITVVVEATDYETGVDNVTANFSEITDDDSDAFAMSFNGTHWIYTFVTDRSDTFDAEFEPFNITFVITDSAGNEERSAFTTVLLYNMTVPVSDDECLRFVDGTTNFSLVTDWESVDFKVVVEWNHSMDCGYFGLSPDDQFYPVASLNFSGLNFSDPETAEKLYDLVDAIQVNIAPDGTFQDSRIYVNSTYFAELNTSATVQLYNLPFDALPNITADPGAAGYVPSSLTYVTYTHPLFGTVGNLTFNVLGFSGYTVTDTVPPTITVNHPSPNTTVTAGPDVLINVTLNGTGTQISNVIVYVDADTYNMADMTCYNQTGSEIMNCYFTTDSLADGSHAVQVHAWDYGGSAPGNHNVTYWNFTSDSAPPVVTGTERNVTGGSGTTPVRLNVSVSDATNVSSVYVGNNTLVAMSELSAGLWQVNTTPNALGCGTGVCALSVNATDYWGNSAHTAVAGFTLDVDNSGPSVTPYVNASSPNKNVKSTTIVNFSAYAPDVGSAGTVNVTMDQSGTLVQLSDQGSDMWSVLRTPASLGCASDALCTVTFNATDAYGNSNSSVTYQIYVDDTPPSVTALQANISEVRSTDWIDFNTTISDTSSVVSAWLNNMVGMANSNGVWHMSFRSPDVGCNTEGVCTLRVNATDQPGNYNDTESMSIIVDNTAPVVSFVFNSTNLTRSDVPITLNITVVEANTLDSVTVNTAHAMTQVGSSNVWYVTDTPANLGCNTDGICTLVFRAYDLAGNVGTDSTTITIDDTAPSVSGPQVSNATRAKSTVEVTVQAGVTDATGVVSVTANGQVLYNVGGSAWLGNFTAANLGCLADQNCVITFVATDALGNMNNTETASYYVDDTAPDNTSAFSASPSSSSATISASFSEDVSCMVYWGTNDSVLPNAASSSLPSNTGAVVISGLSASTTYYYNVSSCTDVAGNTKAMGYGVFNFTTSAAASPSHGGGGGGSGSLVTTYNSGDLTNGESEWDLRRGDRVKFTHDGEEHMIKVSRLTSDYVELEVSSTVQTFKLYPGQSADVDLSGDGKTDIVITLVELTYYKAKLHVVSKAESYLERIKLLPPAKPRQRTVEVSEEVEQPESSGSTSQKASVESGSETPTPDQNAEPSASDKSVPELQVKKKNSYTALIVTVFVILAIIAIIVGLYLKKKTPVAPY